MKLFLSLPCLKHLIQTGKSLNFLSPSAFRQSLGCAIVGDFQREGKSIAKANLAIEDSYCLSRGQSDLAKYLFCLMFNLRLNAGVDSCCLHGKSSVAQMQHKDQAGMLLDHRSPVQFFCTTAFKIVAFFVFRGRLISGKAKRFSLRCWGQWQRMQGLGANQELAEKS